MNVSALREFLGHLKERDIPKEAVRPSDIAFFIRMCLRKFRARFHRSPKNGPIWPETAELLTSLIERNGIRPDERLFINRYGAPLTASGFRFRLRQYVRSATVKQPTLSQKRITPHVFRHTTAVHLVAAGVDVRVIRSWLGHAHLDTTNHYAQANLETKRKALEQADPSLRSSRPPRWKRDTDLLAWLDSL